MGGGITICPMGVSKNASTVNRRDPFLNDIWSRSRNPSRNRLPDIGN